MLFLTMVMHNHQAGGRSNIKILLAQIFSSITASECPHTLQIAHPKSGHPGVE